MVESPFRIDVTGRRAVGRRPIPAITRIQASSAESAVSSSRESADGNSREDLIRNRSRIRLECPFFLTFTDITKYGTPAINCLSML